MTIVQLRYIVAVDRHRHFGRAAEACAVSQPTLSMALRKGEEEIGAVLFDRSRKPIVPTAIGTRIVEQARVILREHDRLAAIIAEERDEIAGDLAIGVLPTLAPYLLPIVTTSFAGRYPGVRVTIREMLTDEMLAELAADRIDAGILATPESLPGMHYDPLFREEFVAYVSKDHSLAKSRIIDAEQLDPDAIWLLGEGHCFRRQIVDLCGEPHPDRPEQEVHFTGGNLETLRHMVENGSGLTLLPMLATAYLSDEQRKRHVRQLGPVVPERTVAMMYGREELKRRLVDLYAEEIRARVAETGLTTEVTMPT